MAYCSTQIKTAISPRRSRLTRLTALAYRLAFVAAIVGALSASSGASAQAQTAPSNPACPYWIDGRTGQPLVGFPLGTPPNTPFPADGHLAFGGHAYQKETGSRWRDLATGNVLLGFPLGTPRKTLLYPNGNLSFAGQTYILVTCPLLETTQPGEPATAPSLGSTVPMPSPQRAPKNQPPAAANEPALPTPPVSRQLISAPASPPPPAGGAPLPAASPPPPLAPHSDSAPPVSARERAMTIRFDNRIAALTPQSIRTLDDALRALRAGQSVKLSIEGCAPRKTFPDGSPCARRVASLKELLARRGLANPAGVIAGQQ